MKKSVINEIVHYEIEWSDWYKYDRFSSGRILPDMPGILLFADQGEEEKYPLLLFACWREGVRSGTKNLFDLSMTRFPDSAKKLSSADLFYRYTIIDTVPADMQDILYWLVKEYEPELNDAGGCIDSKRYREISVREKKIGSEK